MLNAFLQQTLKIIFLLKEMSAALSRSSVNSLDGFLVNSLKNSYGTALVIGNYDAKASLRLIGAIDQTFPFATLDPSKRSRRRVALTALPECTDTTGRCPKGFRLSNDEPNENDDNSASSFYFQVPSRWDILLTCSLRSPG